jgi:MFS family permease
MKIGYGWVMVAVGAVITCVAMGALFALPVYLQPMSAATGWSRAGISGAMTIGFIVMGVAGFGWGVLSDRIGPRPVVLIAAVLLGTGLLVAAQAPNLLVFQVAYGGLIGASGGAFFAPLISATVGWFQTRRGLAVSLVSIGGGVAPMIVSPIATILIETYGWRFAMSATGITALVLLLPISFLVRRPPVTADASATASTANTTGSAGWLPKGAVDALKTAPFIVLAVTFFFCCGAHSGPIFHTVSYAIFCGAAPLAATSIYSVEGIAGLFGRVICGYLADRYGVKKVIVGGLALQAVGIYSYIYVSQLPHFYILAVVLGIVYGGVMPLYSVLAREYFSQSVMGTVLGAASLTSSLGMALGPVGGGWIFDTFGTYHWLYIASAALGVAAAGMALAFPKPKNQVPAALQPA